MTALRNKIYCVPIAKHIWVLHPELVIPKANLTQPSTEQKSLLSSQAARDFLLARLEAAQNDFNELANSPKGSIKYKIYTYICKLLDRVDASETLLRELSVIKNQHSKNAKAKLIHHDSKPPSQSLNTIQKDQSEILYLVVPQGINNDEASSRLLDLTANKRAKHQKMLVLSLCLLPFTTAMFILPGPNIPGAWNAFRAYSHYKALRGAQILQQKIRENNVIFEENQLLGVHWRSILDEQEDSNESLDHLSLAWKKLEGDLNLSNFEPRAKRVYFQSRQLNKCHDF